MLTWHTVQKQTTLRGDGGSAVGDERAGCVSSEKLAPLTQSSTSAVSYKHHACAGVCEGHTQAGLRWQKLDASVHTVRLETCLVGDWGFFMEKASRFIVT